MIFYIQKKVVGLDEFIGRYFGYQPQPIHCWTRVNFREVLSDEIRK